MVVLVDRHDQPIGQSTKTDAHREGLLHRAFSVFIFNKNGQLLIQQRDRNKYHSPGLWANTCCSHPLSGEDTMFSAQKRLDYEMGISTEIVFQESFIYKAYVGGGLTEHEYDHIYTGVSDLLPVPRSDEVMDCKYLGIDEIVSDMQENPETYCVWFRIIFTRYSQQLKIWAKKQR